jgi:thermitase
MKKSIFGCFIVLCLLFALAATSSLNVRATSTIKTSDFVQGEVIVGLDEVTTDSLQAVTSRGGTIIKQISGLNALVVHVEAGKEEEFIQNAKSIPGFKYAERNGIDQAVYTPNDPSWSSQWNMRIIKADLAWDFYKGSTSVKVAIVDTGIEYTHSDLAAHYVSGGYDWVNSDNNPMDDNGHGTHCAGIAAAVMDNSIGVVGVAQCSLWAEKVLNSGGTGSWANIASGITHATDNGAKVISMSLGGYSYSSTLENATTYAWNHGVLVVAAAGNDNYNLNTNPFYPACLSTVICVSSTDSSDQRSSFSNYGSKVELAAPGSSVYSTYAGNSYATLSGTSMATPHVSGLAALLWAYRPMYTNAQLRAWLDAAVDDLGTPGRDIYFGYGRINAYKAILQGQHWQYSFTLSPYIDHLYINLTAQPGGTLIYGIDTVPGSSGYPASVLGFAPSGNTFYMTIDFKDTGGFDQAFIVASISSKAGNMYRTYDGTSWVGPTAVTLTPSPFVDKDAKPANIVSSTTNDAGSQSWQYRFKLAPYIDQVWINLTAQPGGTLIYGYDNLTYADPGYPASCLGWATGNFFYFGFDYKDAPGYYDQSILVGQISTRKGNLYRTIDGTSWVGPTAITLTPFETTYVGLGPSNKAS